MRQRFLQRRQRSMARAPGRDGRLDLSPRARTLGGWLAALLLVLGIAGAVRVFGDSGDGAGPEPSPSGGGTGAPLPIDFGTALGPEGLVPIEARATQFGPGDPFAYSVTDAEPAAVVYVEVRRTDGGDVEMVQAPTEQRFEGGPQLIGFQVLTIDLLNAWGPGAYLMRIYLDPAASPIAEGSFLLVEAAPSP